MVPLMKPNLFIMCTLLVLSANLSKTKTSDSIRNFFSGIPRNSIKFLDVAQKNIDVVISQLKPKAIVFDDTRGKTGGALKLVNKSAVSSRVLYVGKEGHETLQSLTSWAEVNVMLEKTN
jgi:hypothetical protein